MSHTNQMPDDRQVDHHVPGAPNDLHVPLPVWVTTRTQPELDT
jgi:hypothetical protein